MGGRLDANGGQMVAPVKLREKQKLILIELSKVATGGAKRGLNKDRSDSTISTNI